MYTRPFLSNPTPKKYTAQKASINDISKLHTKPPDPASIRRTTNESSPKRQQEDNMNIDDTPEFPASQKSRKEEAAEVSAPALDRKMEHAKELVKDQRTSDGEREFQEQGNKDAEALEKATKDAEEAQERAKKKAEEEAKKPKPPKQQPAPYSFGGTFSSDGRDSMWNTASLATAVKAGLLRLQKNKLRGMTRGSQSAYLKGFEDASRYSLDDEFPQLFGDILHTFYVHEDKVRGHFYWFWQRFEDTSRYIPIKNFPRSFEVLLCAFDIHHDESGKSFNWFMEKFARKLGSSGIDFDELLSLVDCKWEMEEKLKEIGVSKDEIAKVVKAMGGGPSVEEDDDCAIWSE
jgi:hypothetical protein